MVDRVVGDRTTAQPTVEFPAAVGEAVPDPTGTPEASRIIRRQRLFIAVAGLAALVSVAGLVASSFVKSPAQLAADQGAPSASTLTAPVSRQVLSQTVVVRGKVVAGATLSIAPTAAQGASTLVVTRVVKHQGDAVAPGEVLIEVSGRPVIALPGSVPAYRDLRPGDTGADIAELQAALKSLGYNDSDPAGTFGAGTKNAVSKLYQRLGYSVPTTGGPGDAGDAEALQSAAAAVTAAGRTVNADTQAVATAQSALNAARSANPPNQSNVDSAQLALSQAQQTLAYAQQDLVTARQAQAHLVATTGVEMPLNEFVFAASFPAHVASIKGVVGSRVSGELLTLNTGALVVSTVLQRGDQALVKAGMPVQLDAEQLNQQATGTVGAVGDYSAGSAGQAQQAGDGGTGQDTTQQAAGYPTTIAPDSPLGNAWLGQDVRVTIQAAATSGPVLVVPVAAVSTGQDGTTSVTVLKAGGSRVRVPVTAGLDSNGLVEVTPAAGATLNAGDLVVTG